MSYFSRRKNPTRESLTAGGHFLPKAARISGPGTEETEGA